MVNAIQHDPVSLFDFALRESDWVLADLLAGHLAESRTARRRLERRLQSQSGRPGRPMSLPELERLANLTRWLEREGDS